MHSPLPTPDSDALAHSDQLAAALRAEILANGGAMPFARFMELSLYTPGLGYYSAGASKFGESGDFTTAPELGPLFAATLANAIAPVMQQLGPQARFMELGGGSGAFAEVMLKRMLELDALPERYAILEPSADLRERQRERLEKALIGPVFELVEWLDGPFDDDWDGIVFANEVIDALPTPRFLARDGMVYEETVELDADGAFIRGAQPADAMLSAAVRHVEQYRERPFADGYRSELLPQLPYWIQAVAGGMQRGAMLFIDYGYPRTEYYQDERDDGTVRAFYRHQVHNDLYRWPGLQDLTASVDFTALAEAGTGAGFEIAGYCTQASFLLGNGLDALLQKAEARVDEFGQVRLRDQVKKLTLPTGMGERFQVMGFQRDVDFEPAFTLGDLTWRL
ncbi:class I SAM-dependent methyltransferase [Stenotrophomonas rhizophila]|uniref:Class I SAM-dependent methyltransferase n=1 Tax=Stenotrophomonas nematodicola TaxID=2656746 RepID=A0ABW7D1E3_9GAMM|nr:class I SAM-dependent methyltransferase [Stenotrophomonas sp. BIGb0135]MCS4235700.1 SAM-dependent MidA family methyltransferase [Stenotrophomonas sp. BIGb0135]